MSDDYSRPADDYGAGGLEYADFDLHGESGVSDAPGDAGYGDEAGYPHQGHPAYEDPHGQLRSQAAQIEQLSAIADELRGESQQRTQAEAEASTEAQFEGVIDRHPILGQDGPVADAVIAKAREIAAELEREQGEYGVARALLGDAEFLEQVWLTEFNGGSGVDYTTGQPDEMIELWERSRSPNVIEWK